MKKIAAILRPLKKADLKTILKWRNHANVRRYSTTSRPILFDDHVSWFDSHSDVCRLIFEYQGRRAGFVKIDRFGFWSFYLDPKQQGKGLSKIMLELSLFYARQLKLREIFAEVHSANKLSLKLHLALGFKRYFKQKKFTGLYKAF